MKNEIWKDVIEFNGCYQVSSLGRIKSKDRIVIKKHNSGKMMRQFYKGRMLSGTPQKYGHISVHLGFEGRKYGRSLHRLILETFSGKAPHGCECCHNNGISSDNRIENLRWDTHTENNKDRKKHGMYAVGEKHAMAKLTEEQALEIKYCGMSPIKASRKFNIGLSTIHRIRNGESWRFI